MSSSSSAAAPAGVGYDPNAASESSSSSSADMTPLGVESMGQFFAYLGRTATVAHVHASFVVARMRTRTHPPASPPHAAAHAIPPASKRAVPRRAAPRVRSRRERLLVCIGCSCRRGVCDEVRAGRQRPPRAAAVHDGHQAMCYDEPIVAITKML